MKVLYRVKKYNEFQKVINEGSLERSSTLTLYFLKNELGHARVGISIPTKSGTAVVRNRMKRQIRAILDKELDVNLSIDYIFVARRNYDPDNFQQIESDIINLLNKVRNK